MMHLRANGKLLLTSEYMILSGAKALAIPTIFGQNFSVFPLKKNQISWKSYDENNDVWINELINYQEIIDFNENIFTDIPKNRICQLLHYSHQLNPHVLRSQSGYFIESTLDFPKNWGLGTSSTLVYFIAQWFAVNPYTLLAKTFGGSGYDIACAQAHSPIIFQRKEVDVEVQSVDFFPSFHPHIYFVYLNQKKNSREAITHFNKKKPALTIKDVAVFDKLTNDFLNCKTLNGFKDLITQHECYLSEILETPTIKSELFSDFSGAIKSLGGWGGDFVMVAHDGDVYNYFQSRGYEVIIPFEKMIFK